MVYESCEIVDFFGVFSIFGYLGVLLFGFQSFLFGSFSRPGAAAISPC